MSSNFRFWRKWIIAAAAISSFILLYRAGYIHVPEIKRAPPEPADHNCYSMAITDYQQYPGMRPLIHEAWLDKVITQSECNSIMDAQSNALRLDEIQRDSNGMDAAIAGKTVDSTGSVIDDQPDNPS